MNFDDKIKQLEDVCKKLEDDLPLQKSIDLYTQGSLIVKECLTELENSKGSVYKIQEELNNLIETKM